MKERAERASLNPAFKLVDMVDMVDMVDTVSTTWLSASYGHRRKRKKRAKKREEGRNKKQEARSKKQETRNKKDGGFLVTRQEKHAP
jgi:hypothetical protein